MDKLRDKIKEFCERYKIVSAYLFGSYAEGKENLDSDLDLGIYFEETAEPCLLELSSQFSKLLKRDKIDIVILNKASIFMQFRIIQRGKLIYCRDELKRIRYETKIMLLYYDRQYYYQRHVQRNLEKIAEEGIL